jgi:transposase
MTIPGIGMINATAIYSAIGNADRFNTARELSVWLGVIPSQSGSGEKQTSGSITKRGNRYLRKQLVHGARSVVTLAKNKEDRLSRWANALVERRGAPIAYVAMANKLARIIWAVLRNNAPY